MAISTIGTIIFQLSHISKVWPILPQLVQVDVDFVVTTSIVGLTTILSFGVVSKAL
jgi:hypothetical protein